MFISDCLIIFLSLECFIVTYLDLIWYLTNLLAKEVQELY